MNKTKKNLVRLLCALLALVLFLPVICVPTFAVCAHSSLGPQYCEAEHPHAYYRTCTQCGIKIYTGGYATKAHGNGAWGSGTCPDCGTHTYGNIYSEVEHPHYYYHTCPCGDYQYTGGHATKAHGNGAWGSGTCPDCGTHTFVGQTCTSGGTCACGATGTPSGHTIGSIRYLENGHPHRYYYRCTVCNAVLYTTETVTYPHGDGSNGTCPDCGYHVYNSINPLLIPTQHPHLATYTCTGCGISQDRPTFMINCSSCTANSSVAQGDESAYYVFLTIENEGDLGAPITYSIFFTVSYSNTYIDPRQNLAPYVSDLPRFASLSSNVYVNYTEPGGAFQHSCFYSCGQQARYYKQSNMLCATQGLSGGNSMPANGTTFFISEKPSYAKTNGVLGMENAITVQPSESIEVRIDF